MARTRLTSAERSQMRVDLMMRSGGRCEFCGRTLHAAEAHHRQLRSQGGADTLDNLALIHPACHRWAHLNPALAYERGWLVHSWADPATTPIQVRSPT